MSKINPQLYRDPMLRMGQPLLKSSLMFILAESSLTFLDNFEKKWWGDVPHQNDYNIHLQLAKSELYEAFEALRKDLKDDKLPQYDMFDVEIADYVMRIYDMIGFYVRTMEEVGLGSLVRKMIDQWPQHIADVKAGSVLRSHSFPTSDRLLTEDQEEFLLQDKLAFIRMLEVYTPAYTSFNKFERFYTTMKTFNESLGKEDLSGAEKQLEKIGSEFCITLNPLLVLVHTCFMLTDRYKINLVEVIAAKREYNKTRTDHAIETREAGGPGVKKF